MVSVSFFCCVLDLITRLQARAEYLSLEIVRRLD